MRAREEAIRILETALAIASPGAEEVEVSLGGGSLAVTRFADNEVHQATQLYREVLRLRVRMHGRMGRVETSDCSNAGIQYATRQARMLAERLPPGEPGPAFADPQTYWPVDAYDSDTERASALDRMALAGRTIVQAHKRGLLASGYVCTRAGALHPGYDGAGVYAIANSHGLSAYHSGTRASFSVTMSRRDGSSGWAEAESVSLRDLDVDALTEAAVRKASIKGDVRAIGPGRYTVVLEPAAVASLLSFMSTTSGAEDTEHGRSFLSGRIGQRVTGDKITIYDDHAHPLHRGSPFDVEGVAKRKVTLIEHGIAQGPVYGLASARRAGVEATGHQARSDLHGEIEEAGNLVLGGGDATLGDLIGGTRSGILVTRLWYTQLVDARTLALTGMTRDGTFLVERGEVVAPLRNMRFNINLLELLESIDSMTASVWASGLVVPAVRAHGFRFTSGT